jgi:hypothetical protein
MTYYPIWRYGNKQIWHPYLVWHLSYFLLRKTATRFFKLIFVAHTKKWYITGYQQCFSRNDNPDRSLSPLTRWTLLFMVIYLWYRTCTVHTVCNLQYSTNAGYCWAKTSRPCSLRPSLQTVCTHFKTFSISTRCGKLFWSIDGHVWWNSKRRLMLIRLPTKKNKLPLPVFCLQQTNWSCGFPLVSFSVYSMRGWMWPVR